MAATLVIAGIAGTDLGNALSLPGTKGNLPQVGVNLGALILQSVAEEAKAADLDIITWRLERSGTLTDGGGWYYQSIIKATNNPGDTMEVLHVLAKDVGIRGIFSDWPATVTYYANCKGLK